MSSQDRAYKGYTTLLGVVPSIRSLLNDANADPDDLDVFIAQVHCLWFNLQARIDLLTRYNSSRREPMTLVAMTFGV